MVVLKEDKTLMQRILIICQKRKGIDLPTLFGAYEFSVIPRSLFCHEVLYYIENLIPKNKEMLVNNLPIVENEELSKVLILDGMALLYRVKMLKRARI